MITKPSKILFIDHTAVLGGAELSLLDLATYHAECSKVLLFQDGSLGDRLKEAGVAVTIAPASETMLELRSSSGLGSLRAIPELWNLAKTVAREAQDYDVVVANSQKAFVVAALSRTINSKPIIWYLRDILTAKHFSLVNRKIAANLANFCASKVLVNSQATKNAFAAVGGKAELCNLVYNGFDSGQFDRVNLENVNQIRSQLRIGNMPLVGLFSRFSYWKGQHLLLEAVKNLPQVRVILVGKALFGEENYVSELETIANKPELQGRIHWLGFRDDIPALMKACDIIVHTSTEPEPFGRVIVEGQLAQKPVIASAAGGALEIIDDGVNGYLFPLGDAIALRHLIQKLVSDRALSQTIGQRGYESAKRNFSLENLFASFDKAISEY